MPKKKHAHFGGRFLSKKQKTILLFICLFYLLNCISTPYGLCNAKNLIQIKIEVQENKISEHFLQSALVLMLFIRITVGLFK